MHYLDNKRFEELIASHFTDPALHRSELAAALLLLARKVCNTWQMAGVDQDDAVQELYLIAYMKLNRFVPGKGKAFNFFTTMMLNHMRHLYRTHANYHKMLAGLKVKMSAGADRQRRR